MRTEITQNIDAKYDLLIADMTKEEITFLEQKLYFCEEGYKLTRDAERWGKFENEFDENAFLRAIGAAIISALNTRESTTYK